MNSDYERGAMTLRESSCRRQLELEERKTRTVLMSMSTRESIVLGAEATIMSKTSVRMQSELSEAAERIGRLQRAADLSFFQSFDTYSKQLTLIKNSFTSEYLQVNESSNRINIEKIEHSIIETARKALLFQHILPLQLAARRWAARKTRIKLIMAKLQNLTTTVEPYYRILMEEDINREREVFYEGGKRVLMRFIFDSKNIILSEESVRQNLFYNTTIPLIRNAEPFLREVFTSSENFVRLVTYLEISVMTENENIKKNENHCFVILKKQHTESSDRNSLIKSESASYSILAILEESNRKFVYSNVDRKEKLKKLFEKLSSSEEISRRQINESQNFHSLIIDEESERILTITKQSIEYITFTQSKEAIQRSFTQQCHFFELYLMLVKRELGILFIEFLFENGNVFVEYSPTRKLIINTSDQLTMHYKESFDRFGVLNSETESMLSLVNTLEHINRVLTTTNEGTAFCCIQECFKRELLKDKRQTDLKQYSYSKHLSGYTVLLKTCLQLDERHRKQLLSHRDRTMEVLLICCEYGKSFIESRETVVSQESNVRRDVQLSEDSFFSSLVWNEKTGFYVHSISLFHKLQDDLLHVLCSDEAQSFKYIRLSNNSELAKLRNHFAIRIQKWFRGVIARQFTSELKHQREQVIEGYERIQLLHYSSIMIQKCWRSYISRQTFGELVGAEDI